MNLNDYVITNSFPAFTGLFTERVKNNVLKKIGSVTKSVSSRAHVDLMDEVYKGTYDMVMLNSAKLYNKAYSKIRNNFCDYE
jgi:hypothetical protein